MDDKSDLDLVPGDTPVIMLDDNAVCEAFGSFVVDSSEKDTEVENDSGSVCSDKDLEAGEDNGFVRMSRLGSAMGGGGTE